MSQTDIDLSKIKAVVFDWDGTLMDSISHIVASLRLAVADAELPPRTDEQLRDVIGLGLVPAGEKLYPGIEKDDLMRFGQGYRKHYFANAPKTMPLFSGVPELLEQLHQQKYWLAVATGKGIKGLSEAMAMHECSKYFVATRTAEETVSKPDPLMLKELAQELQLSAEQMLMIGDSEYDLEMAANFGCPSIGVRCGVHSDEHFAAHLPVAVVDYAADILPLLGRG